MSLPSHPFNMHPTLPPAPTISDPRIAADIGITSEIAAKLLFLNVKWANDHLKYMNLEMATQQHLLVETWKDLFVLGIGQFMYPLDLMIFVRTKNINIDMPAVQLLQNTISAIGRFGLDSVEYTYLRAMVLFKKRPERQEGDAVPGNGTVSSIIADQHDLNKQVLDHYVGVRYPHLPGRSRSLEQLLHLISQVSSTIIVDLFFRPTIGHIAIESIICDMYQTTQCSVCCLFLPVDSQHHACPENFLTLMTYSTLETSPLMNPIFEHFTPSISPQLDGYHYLNTIQNIVLKLDNGLRQLELDFAKIHVY